MDDRTQVEEGQYGQISRTGMGMGPQGLKVTTWRFIATASRTKDDRLPILNPRTELENDAHGHLVLDLA